MANAIPGFFRIEIRAKGKRDLLKAAESLRALAGELDAIATQNHDDATALVIAHHKTRTASNKLRKQ